MKHMDWCLDLVSLKDKECKLLLWLLMVIYSSICTTTTIASTCIYDGCSLKSNWHSDSYCILLSLSLFLLKLMHPLFCHVKIIQCNYIYMIKRYTYLLLFFLFVGGIFCRACRELTHHRAYMTLMVIHRIHMETVCQNTMVRNIGSCKPVLLLFIKIYTSEI